MTQPGENNPEAFSYVASSSDGQPISGTIDAIGVEQASQMLRAMHLAVLEINPTHRQRRAPLRGDDFIAFNQQLAQLAGAGLPVEEGLRLIATDMRSGRLARTIEQVAHDLESGASLPQAIDASRANFPPLYSRLLDAGIRSGNLPGTLLNLGRHLTLFRQIRGALWRTATYPLVVLIASLVVLTFVANVVIAPFQVIYRSYRTDLPAVTRSVLVVADILRSPVFWMLIAGLFAIVLISWIGLRIAGRDRIVIAKIMRHLPLIGPIVRPSLIARWCDAVRLGVDAGLDLVASIGLASDVVDSAALRADSNALIEELQAGRQVGDIRSRQVLPIMVVRSIQFAAEKNDLSNTLNSLSQMYQQQAQGRLDALPALLGPVLLIGVGAMIAFFTVALLAPIIGVYF